VVGRRVRHPRSEIRAEGRGHPLPGVTAGQFYYSEQAAVRNFEVLQPATLSAARHPLIRRQRACGHSRIHRAFRLCRRRSDPARRQRARMGGAG